MDIMVSLEGKNVIVTGAAQGIGKAIAQCALGLGATVSAVDLNGDGLAAFAKTVPAGRLLTFVGSVADAGFAQSVVDQSVAKLGAVHGLVNNAGIIRAAMIHKMTLEYWHQVLDVHLSGSFYFLQALGKHLLERSAAGEPAPGAIVNITSDAGRQGNIGQINYGAAKAGLLGLTMSAAREWAKHGIRVNTISCGLIETPMTETVRSEARFREPLLAKIPLGRWAQPAEVAKPVCFLLSDAATYITGQVLSVNGGFHMSG